MIAQLSSGLDQALIAGSIAIGMALFGATYRLGTAIGRLSEVTKMLLKNDEAHDARDADHEARLRRLEGWRPEERP